MSKNGVLYNSNVSGKEYFKNFHNDMKQLDIPDDTISLILIMRALETLIKNDEDKEKCPYSAYKYSLGVFNLAFENFLKLRNGECGVFEQK